MSAGKRFKFQGSTIAVGASYSATDVVITGISKASPAVVTAVAHGLTAGTVVKLSDIVGMTELNDEIVIIDTILTDSFALVGVDSTNYTTYVSGGVANAAVFSNWCELTGYNRQGGSSPEIPATTICSTAQEFEIGLPDYGTTQIDYNFAPRTAIQIALMTLYASGEKMAVKVTLPKSGGILTQLGFVQQMSEQAAESTLWTGSMTIRNTGPRFDQAGA